MTFPGGYRWGVGLILAVLLSGCGRGEPLSSSSAETPRRSGEAIPQHRIYLSIQGEEDSTGQPDLETEPTETTEAPPASGTSNFAMAVRFSGCRVTGTRLLAVRPRTAQTWVTPPGSSSSFNFVKAEFRAADQSILYTGWIENPLTMRSPHAGWVAHRCTFELPVDLPAYVDLRRVARIDLTSGSSNITVNGPFTADSAAVDPGVGVSAIESARRDHRFRAVALRRAADPSRAFDFVILGDGFSASEVSITSDEALLNSTFGRRARELMNQILNTQPYRDVAAHLNFWIVGTPSRESGADKPAQNIARDTFYDGTYYTQCLQRLVSVRNPLLALEMASETPFDQMIMLLNDTEHGGAGGDMVTITNSQSALQVLIHELGHSIGRLADQYFYLPEVDPTEPVASEESEASWVEEFSPQAPQPAVRSRDQSAFDACGQLEPPSTRAYLNATRRGGNTFSTNPELLAPNLSLSDQWRNIGWKNYLQSATQAPVRTLFPTATPRVITAADQTRTLRARFRVTQDMSTPWLVAGPDVRLNRIIMNAYAIRVGNEWIDLEAPLGQAHQWAVRKQDDQDFRFLGLKRLNLRAGQIVTVELYYRTRLGPSPTDGDLKNANSLNFVDEPFDPEGMGIFPGAFPNLDRVWRSSYRSRMMMLHAEHDAYENEVLLGALRRSGAAIP